MISEEDKSVILKFAKEYDVNNVILFGSSIQNDREANDIDIGVEGINPELFFQFYGKLNKYLSKPVDLVDLTENTRFIDYIKRIGKKIYG